MIRPMDGTGPLKESSSKAEDKKIVVISTHGNEKQKLTLFLFALFDTNRTEEGHF